MTMQSENFKKFDGILEFLKNDAAVVLKINNFIVL